MPDPIKTNETDNTTNTTDIKTVVTEPIVSGTEPKVENKEPKPEDKEPKVDTKESFLEKAKHLLFGDEKKDNPENKSVTDGGEEFPEDIPDAFSDAASKAGWTDAQIQDFASKYDDNYLLSCVPFLVSKLSEEQLKEEVENKDTKQEISKDDKTEDKVTDQVTDKITDEKIMAILKPYLDKLEATSKERLKGVEERLQSLQSEKQVREMQSLAETADTFFDTVAKDFPVFGQTKELVRFPEGTPQAGSVVPVGAAYEARNAVWTKAVQFHKLGSNWQEALTDALHWYRGKNLEQEVKGKVLTDLKKQESRLSARRTSAKTERTFTSEADEKKAIAEEAARAAGFTK